VNGGQGGGYPPAGGQWPGDGSGGTPYGGHDPYSDPAYGQGSYGGGYGGTQPQGGVYGDPYGQTPAYGPGGPGFGGGPPAKSRTGLLVGLAIGAAVVVIGGAVAIIAVASSGGDDKPASASSPLASGSSTPPADSGGGHHMLTVPETVGPYHRMTGSVADRLAETMRKSMNQDSSGKYADVYAKSKIAIYSKNGDSTHPLIFVGLSADDSPSVAQELQSRTPSEEVDSTFLGMGLGDAKDFPPGPLGGVLRCGTGPMGGSSAAACAWADSSTVGALITPQSDDSAALAGTTLDLRNAAEH
jgi:hypothetical protein